MLFKMHKSDYLSAIETDNCLGNGRKNAKLTTKHRDLYTLDPSVTIFRALYYYWKRTPKPSPYCYSVPIQRWRCDQTHHSCNLIKERGVRKTWKYLDTQERALKKQL